MEQIDGNSLLYYSKGKPQAFRKIRTPIAVCRHCHKELKDYGGHRGAMNPNGVNLKDVWTDVPPVRHRKFKLDARKANALSTRILDRVIELSTIHGSAEFTTCVIIDRLFHSPFVRCQHLNATMFDWTHTIPCTAFFAAFGMNNESSASGWPVNSLRTVREITVA